jgi:hypothetical protein
LPEAAGGFSRVTGHRRYLSHPGGDDVRAERPQLGGGLMHAIAGSADQQVPELP